MRFPGFEGEWGKCLIGDILTIKNGKPYTVLVEQSLNSFPVYGTGGIIGYTDKFLYSQPSVCIGRKGTINKPMFLAEPFWTVDTLFYSILYPKIEPLFIYYSVCNINWNMYNQATGVPSLTSSVIQKVPVRVPKNKNEQNKIATFLSVIDERITTQRKLIDNYKSLIKVIIEKVYQANPTQKMGRYIIEESIKNKNNSINLVYSVSNVNGFIKQTEQFNDRELASSDKSKYKVISNGLFAYNPARINVGSIALFSGYTFGIISPMYICFRTVDGLESNYLKYYFLSHRFKLEMDKYLEGSVRQCLSFESLKSINIPLPNYSKQVNLSSFLNKLSLVIFLSNEYLRNLSRKKDYLLKKIFI